MPMQIILYSRVSTSDQSEHGVSLDSQQVKLKAFAQLHDFHVVDSIVDAGMSAKSLDRPGLQSALGLLRSNQADGLVVVKLDRLTRSISDLQYLILNYFCEKANKELFSVNDCIDTRSAGGRLVLNMLSSVSQWERECVSERTREALRHKIASGQRCGKLRYGYDLADDGKMLVPNAGEQAAITLMKSLREDGYSLRRIASELTSRQIPTKEGGKVWIHTAVGRILQRQLKVA